MSQNAADRAERELAGAAEKKFAIEFADTELPDTKAEELSDLLDQTCRNAVQLLSDFSSPPQTLRVRAGTVSVEVDWQEKRVVVAVTDPDVATTPSATGQDIPVDEPESEPEDPNARYLTAPAVGVFYPAPEPGAPPFVVVGDVVVVGQQVAIIEAMKLMIPLEADLAGRIVKVFKDNGEPVEYGEKVFCLAEVDTD